MRFIPTTLPEVIIVEPRVFRGQRGLFMETYQQRQEAEQFDLPDRLLGTIPKWPPCS